MKYYYIESDEFGQCSIFDTLTGEHNYVSDEEYREMKNQENEVKEFINDSDTHTIFPRRIYFQITRKCNLRCKYCFIKADNVGEEVPFEDIQQLATYMRQKGLMEIRLTGGEPTLHSHFHDVVKVFQKNDIFVSISSNGCWTKDILEFLINEPKIFLIVSLDGKKETHNKYRGDSYDIIIQNLKNLRKYNKTAKIRVNTVLSKNNIKEIENIFSIAKDININLINFIPMRPQVRDNNVKNDIITSFEFEGAIRDMVKCSEKYNIKFNTTIPTKYKEKINSDKVYRNKSSCAAGREGTNLDYHYIEKKYYLYGCSYCPASDFDYLPEVREAFIAGSFKINEIDKLANIWNDDSKWEVYRNQDFKSSNCLECEEFSVRCSGSCPIQNINLEKLKNCSNIIDMIKKQLHENAEWYCYKNIFIHSNDILE